MFALVQFLVDKVKAVVPVKTIKNFNHESFDMDLSRAYEVFWKAPNGEGTGYWYAVVLLVAETEELVEQRTKRVKFPTPKKLEELLAMTLDNEGKMSMVDEGSRRKSKEIHEKRIACEKEKLKDILKRKLKEKKSKSHSLSSEETENPNPSKMRRRGLSPSDSSDEDDLILKSELKRRNADHEQVLRKLKLKQEEIAYLKKKNDQLQDLNISLQTQLLSFLKANDSSNPNSSSMQKSPRVVDNVQINHLKKGVDTEERDSLKQNPPPMQNPPEVVNTVKNSLPNERVDNNIEGDMLIETPPPQGRTDQERIEASKMETYLAPKLEGSNSSSFELSANELYLHNNSNLMKWKDNKMELSPGICIEKDQWLKIVSGKNLNESRFIRNIAVSLWGSETLRERSVTGFACKRFKKDGIEAKRALTPLKVDAVQNGLRFWLKNYQKKEDKEIVKLASKSVVRKLLSDKIMDVSKKQKRSLNKSI